MRERARKRNNWTGDEASMMAGFLRLIGVDFTADKDEWDKNREHEKNGDILLTSWTQQIGHRFDVTRFWVKKAVIQEKKKYKIHSLEAEYDLEQLMASMGHDIECGCDSCVDGIAKLIKQNVPDSENREDAKAYIRRLCNKY